METRLKGSFIYLANAVNDLRSNWRTFALALAPAVILAALCGLPEAISLQHQLARHFEPGVHSVAMVPAQTPYPPAEAAAPPAAPLFGPWTMRAFKFAFVAMTLFGNLLVLCAIRRLQEGKTRVGGIDEAIAVYGDAVAKAPAYVWVVILQLAVPLIALALLPVDIVVGQWWIAALVYLAMVTLMVFGALLYLWLYFAPYALIFDDQHSFHALLFSRDLLRKRFFRATIRIVVFLAVWSGYNSWAAIFFVAVSLIVGPVAMLTGTTWAALIAIDLAAVVTNFATNAFFTAAGVRMYQDLRAIAADSATSAALAVGASAPAATAGSGA